MKMRIISLVTSALMLFTTQAALATVVMVDNPGFEELPVANGWTINGSAGVFNPGTGDLSDEAPEGNYVAYGNVGSLSQIIMETLQSDTVYSVIVEVGDRKNTGFVSYAVNLYAGGVLLASAVSPSPSNDIFVTAVANYDVQPGNPYIGGILKIELVSGGSQAEFDCVRLIKMTDPILNLTQGTRFASIQAAVYEANDGDVIEVPPGTYYEHINCYGKEVTLQSRSGDPSDTILDGRFIDMSSGSAVLSWFKGSVLTCKMSENENMVIEGFTIANGMGTYSGGYRYGGGMYNVESSPTVSNCIFSQNSVTGDGGGMYNKPAFPTVTDCTFIENHANFAGGGMDNRNESNPTVTGCTFAGNTAGSYGGGMENLTNSSPTVTNCTFSENTAVNGGGGMENSDSSNPIITDCVFMINQVSTYDGGAVHNTVTSIPVFTRCDFDTNTAKRYGGAVYNNASSAILNDCTFTDNTAPTEGGAVMNHNASHARYTGCTFTRNSSNNGGAMFNRLNSSPVILDCIFEYNTAAAWGGAVYNYEGTEYPTIAYSQFLGNRANNERGGAIVQRCAGTLGLDHCLFIGNYAKMYAGAFYTEAGTTEMKHCTFTANNAPTRGGGILMTSSSSVLTVKNMIVWGNTSPTAADISRDSGTLSASYSNFGQAIAGEGNLMADPNFVVAPSDGGDGWGDNLSTPTFDESTNDNFGNLRISAGSPCIDAANSFFTGAVDLHGNVRAVDDPNMPDIGIGPVTFLDMGAYEFGSVPPAGGLCGDLNNDGKVDMIDMCAFSCNWLVGVAE